MSLICKKCGYKQNHVETVEEFKKRFPNLEEHDIPYYCGACMDNASEQEYVDMEQEMCNLQCPLGGDETNDCADCDYSGDYHFCNGECVRRMNETVSIWLEDFLESKGVKSIDLCPAEDILKEIEEVKGTISNERLWEKGYDGDELNPHTKNITTLLEYLNLLEGSLQR